MNCFRPVIGIVAVAAVAGFALPSQAAAKSATLYLDNQGVSGAQGCTPNYVLTKTVPSGAACEGLTVAAAGTGFEETDVYTSQSSSVGFTLDAKRPLTGTIYIANYPLVTGGAVPVSTVGGPAGADVTVKVNGVQVGTVSGSGVAAPDGAVAIPVKLKLPAGLNGKKVKSVEADVVTSTGVVLTGASYGDAGQSKLVVPTR
jgi:hypothetical protein